MLFGGRRASPAGVAFAGATTIDSFDAHGHVLIKGHAGVVVLPPGVACDDREFALITVPVRDQLTLIVARV
jgi:hypothetical protein